MYIIKLLAAAIFATAAFAMDLHRQKVANVWIMAGWIWGWCLQYAAREWDGVLQFFAGSSIPIVCLFSLFYFRMLGAGDIKLLSVLGGILGARAAFHLMFLSFFFGGILSLGLLVSSGTLIVRLRYFQGKIGQFEKLLRMWKQEELLDKIRKVKPPFYGSLGNGADYVQQLAWSQLGDYVKSVLQKERE